MITSKTVETSTPLQLPGLRAADMGLKITQVKVERPALLAVTGQPTSASPIDDTIPF